MGHYDGRDIPFYWNIADQFVLFDRFFSSAAGGSVWNHMYWVTGTPGNPNLDEVPEDGFGDLPTIFDRLEQAGVSWKFYVQNYDPRITFRSRVADRSRFADRVGAATRLLTLSRRPEAVLTHRRHQQYYKDLMPARCRKSPISRHPGPANIPPAASRPASASCER